MFIEKVLRNQKRIERTIEMYEENKKKQQPDGGGDEHQQQL
jgi:hypothetical protein